MKPETAILSRRTLLALGTACTVELTTALNTEGHAMSAPASLRPKDEPFGYSLNASTIRGQNLSLPEEVDVAAKADYHAFEPWLPKMHDYVKGGGSLRDLGKRIKDHGMTVESSIGFFEWIVDDPARRKAALESAKRDMEMVAEIGGTRTAAPPLGAHQQGQRIENLDAIAERYRALLDIGTQIGVIPQVEVWGFSPTLNRLSDAAYVAISTDHSQACVLADIYHLHKGGSGFHGVKLLSGSCMQVLHINDYPENPPRDKIEDRHRVYPGDGVAPLTQILRDLYTGGFRGFLSLELFNEDYYKQDALAVAKTGLARTRTAVKQAFA